MRLLFLLSIVLLVSSCSTSEEDQRILELNQEIEALTHQKEAEDSTMNYYVSYANNLHSDLSEISNMQNLLVERLSANPELLTNGDSSIQNEIGSLNDMINKSQEDFNSFKSSYDETKLSSESVAKLIENISNDLEDKTSSILVLQEQLEAVDGAMDDLFNKFGKTLEELDMTKNRLSQTKKFLNTVWYVVDTKKGLHEKGITTIKGGFIGIGANEELSTDFNIAHFSKGNKKSLKKIIISDNPLTKYEVVTSHPSDSYEINDGILTILNQNDFWSLSKYLVVSIR